MSTSVDKIKNRKEVEKNEKGSFNWKKFDVDKFLQETERIKRIISVLENSERDGK